MLKKKGLSAIVATISIVLMTVVAVAIIAGYIVPLVDRNLDEGTECFNYQDYFYFEEEYGYNCHQGSLYGVSVGAKVTGKEIEENVKGFKLAFLKGGESKTVDVIAGASKSATEEIRMLNSSIDPLEIPRGGEVRTYVYNSSMGVKSSKVYPILKSGRVCDESDSIKVDYICTDTLNIA